MSLRSRYCLAWWRVAGARLNNASCLLHPLEEICVWALCKHPPRDCICHVPAYTGARSGCWSSLWRLTCKEMCIARWKKSVPVLGGLPSEQGSDLPSGGNADGLVFLGKSTSGLVWHKWGNEGENHVHCSDAEEFPVLVTRSLFKNFCISRYLWNSFPGLWKRLAKVLWIPWELIRCSPGERCFKGRLCWRDTRERFFTQDVKNVVFLTSPLFYVALKLSLLFLRQLLCRTQDRESGKWEMSTFKMMFSFLVTCILYVMGLNYVLFTGFQLFLES